MTSSGPDQQPRQQGWHRFRPLRTPDAASAIYGTITANAVIAATAGHRPPEQTLALAVATLAVFWLAHVYAQARRTT